MRLIEWIKAFLHRNIEDEYAVDYLCGNGDALPLPLSAEEEGEMLRLLETEEKERAKTELIQRNLRLVVYIARKFDNTGVENDGMGVMCGKRIKFLNTFSYSHDDTYVIKSGKWSYKGEVEDVLYDGCMAWNRWGGNAFEIGYEGPYNISNIRYRNCYVLRSAISIGYTFRHGAMAIHNSGKGTVSNVSYENMHIDNPDEFGIYFSIIKSSYSLPDGEVWGPGNINGVSMKNIYMYNTPPYGNILFGYDKDHTVKNISIENLVINGKKCMSIKDANFTVDQAQAKVSYPVPDSEVTFK